MGGIMIDSIFRKLKSYIPFSSGSPISPSDIGRGKVWSLPKSNPRPNEISKADPITISKLPSLSSVESAKRLASHIAVDNHLLSSHRVIGIGSGSTVPYVVERIVELGGNEERTFIPTGFQSKELIVSAGLRLGDVDQFPTIDVTFDVSISC
jgi:hypothetical protein